MTDVHCKGEKVLAFLSSFCFFFEGFLWQIFVFIGHIIPDFDTNTRKGFFFCILSLEYLTLKNCDADERVVYVWMFQVLVKSFMMLEGALSL